MADGENYGRTTITLRNNSHGRPGLERLLSSASYRLPYKAYVLGSVDQYVLVRMAEQISVELVAKVVSAPSPSDGFEIIFEYMRGQLYSPAKLWTASADIYCYMTEGFFLTGQIHDEFLDLLLSTGDAQIIVEDDDWTKSQWSSRCYDTGDSSVGENIIGRALEAAREDLEGSLWQGGLLRLETSN